MEQQKRPAWINDLSEVASSDRGLNESNRRQTRWALFWFFCSRSNIPQRHYLLFLTTVTTVFLSNNHNRPLSSRISLPVNQSDRAKERYLNGSIEELKRFPLEEARRLPRARLILQLATVKSSCLPILTQYNTSGQLLIMALKAAEKW